MKRKMMAGESGFLEPGGVEYHDHLNHNNQKDMSNTKVNVAEAKRRFSDLIGRVAYGRESITITRRGRPMARLVPIEEQAQGNRLADLKGWLVEDDPFFAIVNRIVADRRKHIPRLLGKRRLAGGTRAKKR